MSLVTVSDGKIYQTLDNAYCPQSCDFLLFVRVLPSPQIEISDGSEISFRITNNRSDGRQQQQLGELHFVIQEIKQDANGGGLTLNETDIQLAKTESGTYRVKDLAAGRYIINVIQDLNGEQNHNYFHSLHRFTVNVQTENTTRPDYPASNSGETERGHSNDAVSVIVIPADSGLLSSPLKSFEPRMIKVVIGTNNTVRWVNQDFDFTLIAADNASDPGFYNATKNFVLLGPNETFEYTFTKAGEFGYHGRPWQRGTVIVVAATVASPSAGAQPSARYLSYDGIGAVPASHVLYGSYDGIDKDNGIVTVNN